MNSLKGLTDDKLIEAFETAKEKNLSSDFIELLEVEIVFRELQI
ncbi:sporulation histidine kinase inhibitor Sda [Jeotgalibacillus marinus]|uniref:Sporulation histidine kinase inhibitor Sda n=1 Tax=Jeotgalibacillus marinus TaxID=86667 RepID=A0ABV3Q1T9_9BACL